MAVGPMLSWKRADLQGVLSRLTALLVLVFIAALVVWYLTFGGPVLAVLAMAIAFWLLGASVQEWAARVKLLKPGAWARIRRQPRASHGMTLAHIGVAVLVMGATGSSAWKEDVVVFASEGTQVQIAGFDLTFEGIERQRGPNYIAQVGTLRVERDGEFVTTLYPERRVYPAAGSSTTESAIRQTLAGDLYASIAEPAAEGAQGQWTLRVLYEPLVNFLWIGTVLLVLGGSVSLSDRRLRVGAPRKTKAAAPLGATPAE